MGLTDRLRRTKTAAAKSGPATIELIANENRSIILGFGLKWRTMIGRAAQADAVKVAQDAKATHYIMNGGMVGYGICASGASRTFSAAAVAARAHGGLCAYAIRLDANLFWLCLIQNSQPVGTDEIIHADGPHVLAERVAALSREGVLNGAVLYTDVLDGALNDVREFNLGGLLDLASMQSKPEDMLHDVPKRAASIPKPVWIMAGIVLLAMLGQRAWEQYEDYQKQQAAAAARAAEESPEIAWATVLQNYLKTLAKPDPSLPAKLHDLVVKSANVYIDGWYLARLKCSAEPSLAAGRRKWNCGADYDRSEYASTSEQFNARAHADYAQGTVEFTSLSTARIVWALDLPGQPVTQADLGPPDKTYLSLVSKLQAYLAALSTKPDLKLKPVDLPVPKRQDGQPQPRPDNFPTLLGGDLNVKGPLRSVLSATQDLADVEWTGLELAFNPKGQLSAEGLKTSNLTLELNGRVYAKK